MGNLEWLFTKEPCWWTLTPPCAWTLTSCLLSLPSPMNPSQLGDMAFGFDPPLLSSRLCLVIVFRGCLGFSAVVVVLACMHINAPLTISKYSGSCSHVCS